MKSLANDLSKHQPDCQEPVGVEKHMMRNDLGARRQYFRGGSVTFPVMAEFGVGCKVQTNN